MERFVWDTLPMDDVDCGPDTPLPCPPDPLSDQELVEAWQRMCEDDPAQDAD